MKDDFKLVGFVVGILVVAAACVSLPIAYMYGRGNAAFLRETQGIDLPWYDALGYPIVIDLRNQPIKP